MRRFLVAGNWKMNTDQVTGMALAGALSTAVPESDNAVEVLVCPPFPYLSGIGTATAGSGVQLGAQDVYFEPSGAFTGEVSVSMLKDIGCSHVILGHSERRHVMGESDELINRKVRAGIKGGLHVILCVGELLNEREAGQTESVLDRQLSGGLTGVSQAEAIDLVIAYEPVWAIGTGVTASPDQAESAHAHIRKWVTDRYNSDFADKVRILYGGSVKPDNAQTLMQQPNVDGALVGGASLKADDFVPIIGAAKTLASA
ncbi:MAG: triose-phosphate isomerase [Fuerstiella sp.]|nr:triose-phosphate isomerase [Fuerstiella sp.]